MDIMPQKPGLCQWGGHGEGKCVGGRDRTVAESDEVCEVQGTDHGKVAWVRLLEQAFLLVLSCRGDVSQATRSELTPTY